MKAGLEKLTNGTATMQIFPNNQVGNEPQMIEGVLTGSLDIAVPSNAPLTNFVPELKIFDMPFLFKDQRHMNRVLRGPARDEIAKAVAAKNLQLLGVYGVGTRHIMTTKKKVLSIDDLKGLKIRTMQSQYHLDAFRAFEPIRRQSPIANCMGPFRPASSTAPRPPTPTTSTRSSTSKPRTGPWSAGRS